MTRAPDLNDLVAINLRYDAGNAALNARAVGQMLAKVLYFGGRGKSETQQALSQSVAKVLGVRRLPDVQVEQGLVALANLGMARNSHGSRWLLTDKGHALVADDVNRGQLRVKGVIERHFPKRIHYDELEAWFRAACIEFYGLYGTQWAAAIANEAPKQSLSPGVVRSLLAKVTKAAGLEAEAESLHQGFHAFIMSGTPEDDEEKWSLGQALLAAKLVAANIGPDPITTDDFRGSLLILDTNVLIAAALGAHRMAVPLAQLALALDQADVELSMTESTRDEYTRAVARRREVLIGLVDVVPLAIIRETRDPFVLTAIEEYGTTQDAFERFFDEMLDPPRVMGGRLAIEVMNDPDVLKWEADGAANEPLKNEIQAIWQQRRNRRKGRQATEHDAGLTSVVEGLTSKGRPARVLTLDRTMHEHALQRAAMHEPPQWVSLDALIQVLAVDASGPTMSPSAFAPLMSRIIAHQCQPGLKTFDPQDLGIMLEIEERCKNLEEEDIRRIVRIVARERLSGRSRDDGELHLAVKRAFRRADVDEQAALRQRLAVADANRRSQERVLKAETRSGEATSAALIKSKERDLRTLALTRGVPKVILGSFLTLALVALAILATSWVSPKSDLPEFLSVMVLLLGPAAWCGKWLLKKGVPRLRADLASARQEAEEEVSRLQDSAREEE